MPASAAQGLAGKVQGVTQTLGGLYSGIVGLGQRKKGNALLNSLSYPTESIPQAVIENQDTARQRANEGLPSAQYSQAMQNIQRQQMAAVNNTQTKRGGLATIAGIQQNTNDATLGLDVKNAQQRVLNQNNLQTVNNQVGQWQDKIWDNNVKQKYIQSYNYAMGLIGAGNNNIQSGVDKGLAGIAGTGAAAAGVTPAQYGGYGGGYGGYNSYGGGYSAASQTPTNVY